MHALKVFSAKGDETLIEWELEDAEKVEEAHGLFDAAKTDGFAAVTPSAVPGEGARAVESFDPALEEIFLLKPIAGG